MIIKNISAHKILASMGDETVEATIEFADGTISIASVPAGISAGKYETPEVDATTAIVQINQMAKILVSKDWTQDSLDSEITFLKGFAANASLAVSAAFFKRIAKDFVPKKFPKILLLLFEGGKHGNANVTFQEFTIIEDSVAMAQNDFQTLSKYLTESNIEKLVGAEGGFSPTVFDNLRALETIKTIFPDKQIALDVADSFAQGEELDLRPLINSYNIALIEDPYTDESWDKWVSFNKEFEAKILVVGDDLTVTNAERIQKAIDLKAVNAVVIKPNQIGTISAAMQAVDVARKGSLKIVVSHRGQETDDDWIADFALAVEADFVKLGGMDRGERIAKYNRLRQLGMP